MGNRHVSGRIQTHRGVHTRPLSTLSTAVQTGSGGVQTHRGGHTRPL